MGVGIIRIIAVRVLCSGPLVSETTTATGFGALPMESMYG